jgi:hypothetical protein
MNCPFNPLLKYYKEFPAQYAVARDKITIRSNESLGKKIQRNKEDSYEHEFVKPTQIKKQDSSLLLNFSQSKEEPITTTGFNFNQSFSTTSIPMVDLKDKSMRLPATQNILSTKLYPKIELCSFMKDFNLKKKE